MKQFVYAALTTAIVAAASVVPALADGPRASSGNNWPGMAVPISQPVAVAPAPAQPHYVLHQGYVGGGKWRSQWVLVQ